MSERKIVVLTPVKNEAWILPLFCKSASIWADYIVIADQSSTDGSREIVLQFPKVVLIENESNDLDEGFRDRLLVNKARELVGNNGVLFRIDADEIFTPNFESDEWDKIKTSGNGTAWHFRWIQINQNLSSYWENKDSAIYGAFVDDGRPYTPHGLIHARKMFQPQNGTKVQTTKEIGLLHFQFADWNRMHSKHRWYQCFEKINFPNKSAIDIYRKYHWMYNPALPYKEIPKEWIEVYKEKYDIDLESYIKEGHYWWDDKVEEYYAKYTPQYFRHIETYRTIRELLFDKRKTILDKLLLIYLHYTRKLYNTKSGLLYKIIVRIDYRLKKDFGI